MKSFLVFFLFSCLALPVFSQSANLQQRFRALSDDMGQTVSTSNSRLQDYDEQTMNSGNGRTYTSYLRRFEQISRALRDNEERLDFLIRGTARTPLIRAERDKYERRIKELESVKTDYDNWLRTVQ